MSLAASTDTATVTAVGQSKSAGDTLIQVSYAYGGYANPGEEQAITVRDPSGLTVVSDSGTEQDYNCAENGLANYTCGDQRLIQYELTDGLGAVTVAGIPLTEEFTAGTGTCDVAMRSRGGTTSSNGYFGGPDQLAMCSAVCSTGACPPPGSCTLDETQQRYANGLLVKTNSLIYGCTAIEWNGK